MIANKQKIFLTYHLCRHQKILKFAWKANSKYFLDFIFFLRVILNLIKRNFMPENSSKMFLFFLSRMYKCNEEKETCNKNIKLIRLCHKRKTERKSSHDTLFSRSSWAAKTMEINLSLICLHRVFLFWQTKTISHHFNDAQSTVHVN
jgi:hypothetical protein